MASTSASRSGLTGKAFARGCLLEDSYKPAGLALRVAGFLFRSERCLSPFFLVAVVVNNSTPKAGGVSTAQPIVKKRKFLGNSAAPTIAWAKRDPTHATRPV